MPIVPKGTFYIAGNAGYFAHYTKTGFTNNPVTEGSQILDSFGNYYEIRTIQPWTWLNSLEMNECELDYDPLHGDRPSTSGTWLSVSDPASRIKTQLDLYLPGLVAQMKEDDNATNATYITAFDLPDYPIQLVFLGTKNVDLIFSINRSQSTPILGCDKVATHYKEESPINIMAIDKATITARRLIWAGEQQIRDIFRLYPIGTGSMRVMANSQPKSIQMGTQTVWSNEVTVHWIRDLT